MFVLQGPAVLPGVYQHSLLEIVSFQWTESNLGGLLVGPDPSCYWWGVVGGGGTFSGHLSSWCGTIPGALVSNCLFYIRCLNPYSHPHFNSLASEFLPWVVGTGMGFSLGAQESYFSGMSSAPCRYWRLYCHSSFSSSCIFATVS